MECKYFIKNKGYSYDELVKEILDKKWITGISDLIFSKEERKNKIINEIQAIKQTSIEQHVALDPTLKSPNTIALQDFINSGSFNINGEALIRHYDKENFIVNRAAEITKETGISEDTATKLAQQEVDNSEIIGNDALALHNIMSHTAIGMSITDFKKMLDGLIADSSGELQKSYQKFKDDYAEVGKQLVDAIWQMKNQRPGSTILRNIMIQAPIKGTDKIVSAHIDFLLVDPEGNLHLYQVKGGTSPAYTWTLNNNPKGANYLNQLALIKRILQYNGVDTTKMTLNILPIRLTYNSNSEGTDYSSFKKVSRENAIDYTIQNGRYAMQKEDQNAAYFISSNAAPLSLSSEELDNANTVIQAFFPDTNIFAQGVQKTNQQYLQMLHDGHYIQISDDPNYVYKIVYGNDETYISENNPWNKNSEILDYVEQNKNTFNVNGIVTSNLSQSIINSYRNGYSGFSRVKGFEYIAPLIDKTLSKYFECSITKDSNGKITDRQYKWKFIENDILDAANILMFRNTETGQIDIVSLSQFDLNSKYQLPNYLHRGDTLAGAYSYKDDLPEMNYGNIELMRVIALLNEIAPQIKLDDKFGNLTIVSSAGNKGMSREVSIESAVFTFKKLSNIVQKSNKDFGLKDNLKNRKYLNPLDSLFQSYQLVLQDLSLGETTQFEDFGILGIQQTDETYVKLQKLQDIIDRIEQYRPSLANEDGDLNELINSKDKFLSKLALLYREVMNAYAYYAGYDIVPEKGNRTWLQRNFTISSRNDSANIRLVTEVVNDAIDEVSASSAQYFFNTLNPIIQQYFRAKGYNVVQNSIIGNQESLFRGLFEVDDSGNITTNFKNPYKDSRLDEAEKEFLKKALFEINKVRAKMNGQEFNYKDADDPRLQEYIEKKENHYFWAPLERASKGTQRLHPWEYFKKFKDKVMNTPEVVQEKLDQFLANNPDEAEQFDRMTRARNRFRFGESGVASRTAAISHYGTSFFETNVANLLVDFVTEQIRYENMNRALQKVRIIKNQMFSSPNKEEYSQIINEIDDYLKVNIFGQSIMDPASEKLVRMATPLKSLASSAVLMGNTAGAIRDTFQGLLEMTSRVISRYMLDVSAKDVMKAYKEVVSNIFTNAMTVNKLSALAKMYKLTFDTASPEQALKSDRSGILNPETYLYATLRRPDFLNRMVVFASRAIHDGTWDALYIENGQLVYNWRLDKRFNLLANDDKSDIVAYNRQKDIYNSYIRMYNLENPDKQISYSADLPLAYTNQEINIIKNASDSIYGYYNQSTKMMYEHQFVGWYLGQFTTWLNAIYTNYAMKPAAYRDGILVLKQAMNRSGDLLYFDENMKETTVDTGHPIYENTPEVIQGILYTLRNSWRAAYIGYQKGGISGSYNEFIFNIWKDPKERANIIKFLTDLLVSALYTTIIGTALTADYKDYKKTMDSNSPAMNAFMEATYKGLGQSTDSFLGMLNIAKLGTQISTPLTVSYYTNILSGLGSVIKGNKSLEDWLVGMTPVIRGFKDTEKAMQ